jgi:hypothetical protein
MRKKYTSQLTVRERSAAICAAEEERGDYTNADDRFTVYRLAQLLRVFKRTLLQDKPASSLLDWALRRCEEDGVGYYVMMEGKLGMFKAEK